MVIPSLDDVSWLLNVRAFDVPYNPVIMAYAVIHLTTRATENETIDIGGAQIGSKMGSQMGSQMGSNMGSKMGSKMGSQNLHPIIHVFAAEKYHESLSVKQETNEDLLKYPYTLELHPYSEEALAQGTNDWQWSFLIRFRIPFRCVSCFL